MSRTKPNHRRVWGTRPLRTVGDRRKARPHGADARDYAAVFRVFKVPVGRILLSHSTRSWPRKGQEKAHHPHKDWGRGRAFISLGFGVGRGLLENQRLCALVGGGEKGALP